MSDIKDILGVGHAGAPGEKAEKAKEPKLVKPKGMSREAFALLSASHPLVPSQLVGDIRKKGDLASLKAKAQRSHRGERRRRGRWSGGGRGRWRGGGASAGSQAGQRLGSGARAGCGARAPDPLPPAPPSARRPGHV